MRAPVRLRLGVVIEQSDELAARHADPLVVGRAEAAVLLVANHPCAELAFGHVRRSVARPVVHHDGFEIDVLLARERDQTRAQQLLPVPVHHHHGDQLFMLTGASWHALGGPGTDKTASEFPAKGAGNPLAVLSVPGEALIPCYIMSLEVGNFSYDTGWRDPAPHTTEAQSPTGGDLQRVEDIHALPAGD